MSSQDGRVNSIGRCASPSRLESRFLRWSQLGYGVTHRRGEKSLGFRAGGGDDECPSDIHPAS